MATKTITIDLDAYRRLKRAKRADESFSQTIKRVVRSPFDFEAWLRLVRSNVMSKEAMKAVENQVARRRLPSRRER